MEEDEKGRGAQDVNHITSFYSGFLWLAHFQVLIVSGVVSVPSAGRLSGWLVDDLVPEFVDYRANLFGGGNMWVELDANPAVVRISLNVTDTPRLLTRQLALHASSAV